jgi:sugar (pentulose or hexulose) kinase
MSVIQVRGGGGAPLGAAMLARFGVGACADLPSAATEWIDTGRRFAPDSGLGQHYRRRLDRYEAALVAVRALTG